MFHLLYSFSSANIFSSENIDIKLKMEQKKNKKKKKNAFLSVIFLSNFLLISLQQNTQFTFVIYY